MSEESQQPADAQEETSGEGQTDAAEPAAPMNRAQRRAAAAGGKKGGSQNAAGQTPKFGGGGGNFGSRPAGGGTRMTRSAGRGK